MKKFAMMFEDLWVAIAFAEEGIYENPVCSNSGPGSSSLSASRLLR